MRFGLEEIRPAIRSKVKSQLREARHQLHRRRCSVRADVRVRASCVRERIDEGWARRTRRERERVRTGERTGRVKGENERGRWYLVILLARSWDWVWSCMRVGWLVRTGTKCHKVRTRTQRREAWCTILSSFGPENLKDRDKRGKKREALRDATRRSASRRIAVTKLPCWRRQHLQKQ